MTRKSAGITFGVVHLIFFGVFLPLYFGVFGNRLHDSTKEILTIDGTLVMLLLTLVSVASFYFGRWHATANPPPADPVTQEILNLTDANFRRFREQTAINQDFSDDERQRILAERDYMVEHFATLAFEHVAVQENAEQTKTRLVQLEVFEKMARKTMNAIADKLGADAFKSIRVASEAYRQAGGDLEAFGRDFSAGKNGSEEPTSGRGKFRSPYGSDVFDPNRGWS